MTGWALEISFICGLWEGNLYKNIHLLNVCERVAYRRPGRSGPEPCGGLAVSGPTEFCPQEGVVREAPPERGRARRGLLAAAAVGAGLWALHVLVACVCGGDWNTPRYRLL